MPKSAKHRTPIAKGKHAKTAKSTLPVQNKSSTAKISSHVRKLNAQVVSLAEVKRTIANLKMLVHKNPKEAKELLEDVAQSCPNTPIASPISNASPMASAKVKRGGEHGKFKQYICKFIAIAIMSASVGAGVCWLFNTLDEQTQTYILSLVNVARPCTTTQDYIIGQAFSFAGWDILTCSQRAERFERFINSMYRTMSATAGVVFTLTGIQNRICDILFGGSDRSESPIEVVYAEEVEPEEPVSFRREPAPYSHKYTSGGKRK